MQYLKPCPFCGSRAMLIGGGNSSRGRIPAHVECASRLCLASTKEVGDSKHAAEIWNSRVVVTSNLQLLE